MEREYKMSIFYKVLAISMVLIFGFFSVAMYMQKGTVILPPLAFFIATTLHAFNQFVRRVIVSHDNIIRINILGKITIPRSKITGFRIGNKVLWIYYEGNKLGLHQYEGLAGGIELTEWFRQNYPDLDQQERENEYDQIILEKNAAMAASHPAQQARPASEAHILTSHVAINPGTDVTKAELDKTLSTELDEKLEWYFKVTIAYDALAGIGFLFNVASRSWMVMYFMIIYPWVGLIIIAQSKGLIRLCFKATSPRHSLFVGVIICVAVMIFTQQFPEQPYTFDNRIILSIATAITFIAVAWYVDTADKKELFTTQRLWLLIIGFLYGFGAIMQMERIWGYFLNR